MKHEEIKELIAMIDASGLTHFSLSTDDFSLDMHKGTVVEAAVAPAAPVAISAASAPMACVPQETVVGELVKAPIVGTFYTSPGEGKPSFVSVGDMVKKGDTLCILEAMKVMNEIPSPCDGCVAEILAENEGFVEYGAPLFRIAPR